MKATKLEKTLNKYRVSNEGNEGEEVDDDAEA
jgi:hypothetical protein